MEEKTKTRVHSTYPVTDNISPKWLHNNSEIWSSVIFVDNFGHIFLGKNHAVQKTTLGKKEFLSLMLRVEALNLSIWYKQQTSCGGRRSKLTIARNLCFSTK